MYLSLCVCERQTMVQRRGVWKGQCCCIHLEHLGYGEQHFSAVVGGVVVVVVVVVVLLVVVVG